jgi:hypothetical protein
MTPAYSLLLRFCCGICGIIDDEERSDEGSLAFDRMPIRSKYIS